MDGTEKAGDGNSRRPPFSFLSVLVICCGVSRSVLQLLYSWLEIIVARLVTMNMLKIQSQLLGFFCALTVYQRKNLDMRVVIDPRWVFADALAAAWEAYSGGQELGATNRIRVLEQWANVVGRERAIAEIENALGAYKNLDDASHNLGLSKYAIHKLRKAFNGMPSATPMAAEPQNIYELLRRLPEINFITELNLLTYALPRFARLLGYAESELLLEPSFPGVRGQRLDAALTVSGSSPFHCIFEIKISKHATETIQEYGKQQLSTYLSAAKVNIGVLLTQQTIYIQKSNIPYSYTLRYLTSQDAVEIEKLLTRPLGSGTQAPVPSTVPGNQLQELLNIVANSSTNDEKKKSLENLAAQAFDVHPFIQCKYKDIRTASSEIDIVCEYIGSTKKTFLDEYGRYFWWSAKTGTNPLVQRKYETLSANSQRQKPGLV